MSVRRILLLISTFALVAFASPVTAAAAEAPTLTELRAQLRQTRQSLERARQTLTVARTDLTETQAVLAAVGGVPLITDGTAASGTDVTTDPVTTDPTTDPATTSADSGTVPASGDADLAALIAAMDPLLAARLMADGVIAEDEIAALEARVAKWRAIVRRVRSVENTLEARVALRLQIADWNRRGAWRPLIEIAARRYGVDPDGLYRLMMYESGGRRYAGTTYKGLFQYHPGTWAAGWNPWRSESIFNGWAQIRATAYAIGRGMGPSNWPSTYPLAF